MCYHYKERWVLNTIYVTVCVYWYDGGLPTVRGCYHYKERWVLNIIYVTVCVYWYDGGEVTQSGGVTTKRRCEY